MSRSVVYDFHLHTYLSDGVLLPVELIRRCVVKGYAGMMIADHASPSTIARVIAEVQKDCAIANRYWDIEAYAGIELTHCPAASIAELAFEAKQLGAALVVVHGESPVEPVEPGTNLAAVSCRAVDILAHPGLITPETAKIARENDVFIEVTSRQGHGMANGHVVRVTLEAGAELIVNSDSHKPEDLLTPQWAEHVARCAGIPEELLERVLIENPKKLLARIHAPVKTAGWA